MLPSGFHIHVRTHAYMTLTSTFNTHFFKERKQEKGKSRHSRGRTSWNDRKKKAKRLEIKVSEGWRIGSTVSSTSCSCRRFRLGFQHPHTVASQLLVTLILGDPMPSSEPHGLLHTHGTHKIILLKVSQYNNSGFREIFC